MKEIQSYSRYLGEKKINNPYNMMNTFITIKEILIYIYIISILLIIPNCGMQESIHQTHSFYNGVLDFSQTEFSLEENVKLQGEWEFYWSNLIDPKEYSINLTKERTTFSVPGETWRSLLNNEGIGFASYRLRLVFRDEDIGKRVYFKVFQQGGAAQKFFLDDVEKLEIGKVGTTKDSMIPTRKGGFFLFEIKQKAHYLTLHISNFYHYDGAFWYPPEIGLENNAIENMQKVQAKDSFIWGAIFLIFIHHLFIFFRMIKMKSYLFFAFYSLLILIQLFSFASLDFIYILFPNLPHKIAFIFSLIFTIIMPFYLFFLKNIFPLDFSNKMISGISAISFSFLLFLILFPTEVASYITLPCLFITLVGILYSNYGITIAVFRKRSYSKSMLFTMLLIFAAAVNDMLFSYNLISTQLLIKYSYLLSVVLQSIILSGIFSDTLKSEEILIDELKTLNERLESKVQKRTEQLQKEKDKAVNANLWKNKFIALVSHDLRSPISSVYGVLEVFESEDSLKEEEDKELLASAKAILNNSLSMVEHLLNLSRFNSGTLVLNYSKMNLINSIEEQKVNFSTLLKEKSIQFLNLVPDEIILNVDNQIIYEVFRNLIFNAIKYTDNGGYIKVSYSKDQKFDIISIEDSGVGIPKEKIPELFDGGSSSEGTKGEKGFGVGLKLCKELIELHKGEIIVNSELGKGTTFHIKLQSSLQ